MATLTRIKIFTRKLWPGTWAKSLPGSQTGALARGNRSPRRSRRDIFWLEVCPCRSCCRTCGTWNHRGENDLVHTQLQHQLD